MPAATMAAASMTTAAAVTTPAAVPKGENGDEDK
jgi:hypothetical protein